MMARAAISGLTTMIGTALAIWAVYQNVRLDWPETALICGVTFFTVGAVLTWQMLKDFTEGGNN